MLVNRVVPVLLLKDGLLVKTEGFKKPVYIGDPINAVRILNEKEVDELVVLDMDPTRTGSRINFSLVEEIVSEAFMPVAYGGGIDTVDKGRSIVGLGVEKVVVNSAWHAVPDLVAGLSATLGAQAVVGSVDFRRKRGRVQAVTRGGALATGLSPVDAATALVDMGAGEIFLNSVARDGTMTGFDLAVVSEVAEAVPVPVMACGGAGTLDDLRSALVAGASAVAAGSMFVFHGRHRAVLITYPERAEILAMMQAIDDIG